MIDLISDTVTKPSPEMRQAMADAPVGDSQKEEDPTVNRLQDAVCELLGKEAAVYLPSATMANMIAYKINSRPGDEMITDYRSHAANNEGGHPGAIAGLMVRTVEGVRGIFTDQDVLGALRPDDIQYSRTSLISVENTHNYGGGAVWPMEKLTAIKKIAEKHGLKVHMDGARLMNAVVASGIPAKEWASQVDTLTICFSKGLGAPVGAILAGEKDFIKEARRCQKTLGGAMRQAGIVAAGALYGLQHNVDRLAEDHANAKLLAERLTDEPSLDIDASLFATNIVVFEVARTGMTAAEFAAALKARGVRMGAGGPYRIRAVTHMNVTRKDIIKAAEAVHQLLTGK